MIDRTARQAEGPFRLRGASWQRTDGLTQSDRSFPQSLLFRNDIVLASVAQFPARIWPTRFCSCGLCRMRHLMSPPHAVLRAGSNLIAVIPRVTVDCGRQWSSANIPCNPRLEPSAGGIQLPLCCQVWCFASHLYFDLLPVRWYDCLRPAVAPRGQPVISLFIASKVFSTLLTVSPSRRMSPLLLSCAPLAGIGTYPAMVSHTISQDPEYHCRILTLCLQHQPTFPTVPGAAVSL